MRKLAIGAGVAAALLWTSPVVLAAKITPPGIATISATCTSVTVAVNPRVVGYAIYYVRPVVSVNGVVIDPNLSDVSWVNEEQGELHYIYFPNGELPITMHKGRNRVGLKMYWFGPGPSAKSTAHTVVTCP